MPSSPSAPPDFLTRRPFAHRGRSGPGVVENSRAAFLAAIAGGYGIELDVRASRDGVAFVFHDALTDRLTGRAGAIADRPAAALDHLRLAGMDETIPRLAEVLDMVGARAPILIEVKSSGGPVAPLCRAVAADLSRRTCIAAVMSFDPAVGRWFSAHAPERTRGLVVTEEGREGLRGAVGRRLAAMSARPHFLACDIRDLPSAFARGRRAAGLPVLTWTVRTPAQRAIAAAHADQIIFEGAPA